MDFNDYKLDYNEINKISEQFKQKKDELKNIVEEGSAGGGFVKISLNGDFELVDLQIDKDIVDPDRVNILSDLIKSAYIDAYEKIKEKASPLGMPDLGNLGDLDFSKIMNFFKKD